MPGRDRDDDEIDDESLSSMRTVWLSMRDEDPPAGGMSALMAAAAAKATEMSPARPAWWQRALAQLRRPPALAFATVILLVGGAVLVTRNQDKMAVKETAPAPREELRVQEQPVAPAPATGGASTAPVPEPAPPKQLRTPKPRAQKKVEDSVGPNEPSRDHRFDGDDAPRFGGEGQAVETAPAIVDTKPADAPGTRLSKSSPGSPVDQLARQAEAAAARGDCPAVRTLVARIRQQDEAFFQARLGKTAAVMGCL